MSVDRAGNDLRAESTAIIIGKAGAVGVAIVLAGTIPRNVFFFLNLRHLNQVPWALPVTGLYLWVFWRFLRNTEQRRKLLRANRIPTSAWFWSLAAGLLGIVGLVLALKLANRFVTLPEQTLPDLSTVPKYTVATLLLAGAPIAALIEESAFRGYMQGPLERRCGLPVAILITGTMFAMVHLDFTPILWPYYVAVAALYGVVTSFTNSILPAIVLHTAGNTYSNLDLWLHGRAEWQMAPRGTSGAAGSDDWLMAGTVVVTGVAMYFALVKLRSATAASPP